VKVAVDYQSVSGKPTGIGVFTKNLIEAIRRQAPDIEFVLYQPDRDRDLRALERIWWESMTIPFRSLRDKPQLVYSPGFSPAIFSPFPCVVTVNDLIGLTFPGNQGLASSFYWRRWLPAALKRAKCLVAISEATKKDMVHYLGIPADRIPVVPDFVHPRFQKMENNSTIIPTLRKYPIREPYFICVGSLEPRKNLVRLIEAYDRLRRDKKNGFTLAIAGKGAAAEGDVRRLVRERGLEEHISFLGYVPEEDLAALYNGALGYVTVSLYEGFGLPALEAMQCGKSGVSSNRSSLPEVTGDTALLVDPEDTRQIAEALHRFAADAPLREELGRKARERAKMFSAEKAADQMIRIFRNACAK